MSNKYLILGHARHGKDTFAELLCKYTGLTAQSSSWFIAETIAFPRLKNKYNYSTVEQCYKDRVNHRVEWLNLIKEYNTPDKTRLAKEILKTSDIYIGMRSREEYEACLKENLFDKIFYVCACPRLKETDSTMCISFDPKKHIFVFNHLDSNFLEDYTKMLIIGHGIK